jgi:membrane fusion protein (multidrug efflux system)
MADSNFATEDKPIPPAGTEHKAKADPRVEDAAAKPAEQAERSNAQATTREKAPADEKTAALNPPWPASRKWLLAAGIVCGLAVGGYFLVPWVVTALNTVSTDDAYVNGHVTFVAPRVAGQVINVLVDDNQRVKKGDLLVQLDKEPYQVQVNLKKDALVAAERDLQAAEALARGQIANLGANVATLNSKKATLELSRANLRRGEALEPTGGMSKEELDQRRQTVKVDQAAVEQALQTVYASRVSLGLPAQPAGSHGLAEPLPDLDPTSSATGGPRARARESAAQPAYFAAGLGSIPQHQAVDHSDENTQGNLDHIYDRLVREVPAVKQSGAKVPQALDDLAQAELNLRYCDIVSDIDGQVTSRNVNPGNYVQMGQSLMAVRSLTEIWIDANFKETQLARLRIGQRVRCDVDMYGSRREFEGRITGFTMGTGQTLALLPPQNATGNFVKIVQRLPVRIELTKYDPDNNPLFVGLSVSPYVYFKEPAAGPHAGDVLQPFAQLPQLPTEHEP